jgi:hypothetical protein
MSEPQVSAPPFWNIVGSSLPVAAFGLGLLVLAASKGGRGDFAGALGRGVLFFVAIGVACLIGEIASIIALVRQERLVWLSILGVIGNAVVLLPLVALLLRD